MSVFRTGGTTCHGKLLNYFSLLQRGLQRQSLPRCLSKQTIPSSRAVTCSHYHHKTQFHTTLNSSSLFLNGNIPYFTQRQHLFSTTSTVHKSKNFDIKKLQRYNIYDPQGTYILTSEIYNIEKFCDGHKRFTFEPIKEGLSSKAEAGLESVQIVAKPMKDHAKPVKDTAQGEKQRVIKLSSTEAPWVIDKVKRLLLEHRTLLLDIKGKKSTSIRQLVKDDWISQVCTISTVKEEERNILLKVTMPDTIDSAMFKLILVEACAKDAAYMEQIKDMLTQTAEARDK